MQCNVNATMASAQLCQQAGVSHVLCTCCHVIPSSLTCTRACRSDEVLKPEHSGLKDALDGLQLGEVASEQGSTAGTAPPRHSEGVPPRPNSAGEVKRDDIMSSVPDDIKSSVPKSVVEGVQVRMRPSSRKVSFRAAAKQHVGDSAELSALLSR